MKETNKLTAAEKRRRMCEYASQFTRTSSKAKPTIITHHSEINGNNAGTSKSPGLKNTVNPTHNNNYVFEIDANSKQDILYNTHSSTKGTKSFLVERLSLFPDGINPLDNPDWFKKQQEKLRAEKKMAQLLDSRNAKADADDPVESARNFSKLTTNTEKEIKSCHFSSANSTTVPFLAGDQPTGTIGRLSLFPNGIDPFEDPSFYKKKEQAVKVNFKIPVSLLRKKEVHDEGNEEFAKSTMISTTSHDVTFDHDLSKISPFIQMTPILVKNRSMRKTPNKTVRFDMGFSTDLQEEVEQKEISTNSFINIHSQDLISTLFGLSDNEFSLLKNAVDTASALRAKTSITTITMNDHESESYINGEQESKVFSQGNEGDH